MSTRFNPITGSPSKGEVDAPPEGRKKAPKEVKISSVSFGSEGARDFSTQTKDDYKWPGEGRQAQAVVLKSTLRLGEWDRPSYETETAKAYTPPQGFSPSKSVQPRAGHSCVDLGTHPCDFSTTMRDGFPPRQLDLKSLRANKEATAEVTRTHFILGDEPARFDTTYRATMAPEGVLREAAKTNAKKQDRYVLPKHGKFSSVPFGSGNDHPADDEDPSATRAANAAMYTTTNTMPVYDKYEKGKPVDPSSWASFGGSGAGDLTAVYKELTTSGKPLSAVAFGYDKPDYSTAAQESMGTKPHQVKLKEPYMPKLTVRYCVDHPALQGTPLKKPADALVERE